MSVSTERLAPRLQPIEKRVMQGAGLVVVHADTGDIWTQRDRPREMTNRIGGFVSVAFETRKYGESHQQNVLGAVPEIFDDPTLAVVRHRLYTTDNLQSTPQIASENGKKPVRYSLAVVVYDGSQDVPFKPFDTGEAEPYAWMDPYTFLNRADTRPLAQHAVSYLTDEGILKKKIEAYLDPHQTNEYAIPDDFAVENFYHARERLRDMEPQVEYRV